MVIALNKLDKKIFNIVRKVGQSADKHSLPIYVVGGVVRDILLKKDIFDLDFVVEGDGIKLANILARELNLKPIVHSKFGTATLILQDNIRLDFVSARKEVYSYPGALPNVELGKLADDLFRRDFTINAMAIAINQDNFGVLIDKFNGSEDLSSGIIRVLHDKSYTDDPTRILRAVRFEQRLKFSINSHDLGLIKKTLKSKAINSVGQVRYFNEIKKMIVEENALACFKRLRILKAEKIIGARIRLDLKLLSKTISNIKGVKRDKFYQGQYSSWIFLFMAMVSPLSVNSLSKLIKRFGINNHDRNAILHSLKKEGIAQALSQRQLKGSQIYCILNQLPLETILFIRAYTSNKNVNVNIDHYLQRIAKVKLLSDGNDIKSLGNIAPKEIGKIISKLLLAKIDGLVKNKKEELNLAKKIKLDAGL